jgi:hypothetical protein
MQLPGGIVRPMIAVAIEGPNGRRLLDGLLDTGSDRTFFQLAKQGRLAFPFLLSPTDQLEQRVDLPSPIVSPRSS